MKVVLKNYLYTPTYNKINTKYKTAVYTNLISLEYNKALTHLIFKWICLYSFENIYPNIRNAHFAPEVLFSDISWDPQVDLLNSKGSFQDTINKISCLFLARLSWRVVCWYMFWHKLLISLQDSNSFITGYLQ